MKRVLFFLVTTLLALASLTGCTSYVPFTQELRTAHGLSRDDLKNLQFYVSHRITLRREVESGGSQITPGHKLLLVSGKTIEEVVVEEHTPGVATQVGDSMLSVSFEPGASILFAAASEPGATSLPASITYADAPPDPFPGNNSARPEPLQTRGSPASGTYWLSLAPGGDVTYQGRVFKTIDDTVKAHLLINAQSLEEVVKKRKVLPGMRLPSR